MTIKSSIFITQTNNNNDQDKTNKQLTLIFASIHNYSEGEKLLNRNLHSQETLSIKKYFNGPLVIQLGLKIFRQKVSGIIKAHYMVYTNFYFPSHMAMGSLLVM